MWLFGRFGYLSAGRLDLVMVSVSHKHTHAHSPHNILPMPIFWDTHTLFHPFDNFPGRHLLDFTTRRLRMYITRLTRKQYYLGITPTWLRHTSIVGHISCHIVSCHILFYQISSSQLCSASISHSTYFPSTVICHIFLVVSYLFRLSIFQTIPTSSL